MGFWLCCCWAALWTVVSAGPPPQRPYVLRQNKASFEQAKAACSPGVLTSVTDHQEVQQICDLINAQTEVSVWVGLMKFKNECTTSLGPLRGFRWLDGSGLGSQVVEWLEQPVSTCTEVLCAVLRRCTFQAQVKLGLVAVSCKDQHQFICKQTGGPPYRRQTTVTPTAPEPSTPPARLKPDPETSPPGLPTPGPETEPGSGCQHSPTKEIRSFMLDPNNSTRITVECWSDVTLALVCSGRPAAWRLLDGSPADFGSICQVCDLGFHKDGSGHCVDVDECSGAPCRSAEDCLNTKGSYRCVCANHTHNATCDDAGGVQDSWSAAGILVPVLVVVSVLLVVVAVAIKCCLRRREKKRRREEAAMKMKEAT